MIAADKPPLEEAYLEHFGVKGMKWGQRKSRSSSEASDGSRKATLKKVAKGAAVVGGAAAVALLMTRQGRTAASSVLQRMTPGGRAAQATRAAEANTQRESFRRLLNSNPFAAQVRAANSPMASRRVFAMPGGSARKVYDQKAREATYDRVMKTKVNDISQSEWRGRVSALSKDIAGANADQDRWMRSQGLGAALNRG